MSFTSTSIPVGQILDPATTISTAESYLYTLVLFCITGRNLAMVSDQLCQATAISNYLYALNDPNISTTNYQKIILALNNICTPFNSQIYPTLNL